MHRQEIFRDMHRNPLLRQLLNDAKILILKIKGYARNSAGGEVQFLAKRNTGTQNEFE